MRPLILIISLLLVACKGDLNQINKPFYSLSGEHIGDSVFIGNTLQKIVFRSGVDFVDSITFDANGNYSSFEHGEMRYESVKYHEDGRISAYSFRYSSCTECNFTVQYDNNGENVKLMGSFFFQGRISDTNTETLEIKRGTELVITLLYPSPPDFRVRTFIRNKEGEEGEVFFKSRYVGFSSATATTLSELGDFETNICIELRDTNDRIVREYSKSLFYRVVE